MRYPTELSDEEQEAFLEILKESDDESEGLLRATEIVILDSKDGLAIFDVYEGKLLINLSHPSFIRRHQYV